MCFPDKDFTMTQLTPIKNIDPNLLEVLTPNEKRELLGYKPLENGSIQTPSN